jgi:predicted nucleic acid-binding protein
VRHLLAHDPCATVRTSQSEVASALTRLHREGAVSQAEMLGALAALKRDLEVMFLVEVTARVVALSVDLLERHPLRAGDALQLAAAIEAGSQLHVPVLFVAFDQRLLRAAKAEGLKSAPE